MLKLISNRWLGSTIFVCKFEAPKRTNYTLKNDNVILHYLLLQWAAMFFLCPANIAPTWKKNVKNKIFFKFCSLLNNFRLFFREVMVLFTLLSETTETSVQKKLQEKVMSELAAMGSAQGMRNVHNIFGTKAVCRKRGKQTLRCLPKFEKAKLHLSTWGPFV